MSAFHLKVKDPYIVRLNSVFRRRPETTFYIILAPWFAWSLIQVLATVQSIPYSVAEVLYLVKVPSGIIAIAISSFFFFRRRVFEWTVASLAIGFGCYTVLNTALKGGDWAELAQPGMYVCWAIGLFVAAPAFLNTQEKILIFLRITFWSTVATFLIGSLLTLAAGNSLYAQSGWGNVMSESRLVLGFSHPGYAAQLTIGLMCLGLLIGVSSPSRKERFLTILICLAAFPLVYLTASRTSLLFIGTTLIMLVAARYKKGLALAVSGSLFALVLFTLLSFYLLAHADWTDINQFSSGRTLLWVTELERNWAANPISALFGGDQAILRNFSIRGFSADEGGVITAIGSVYRLDSLYLDLILMYGLVGLIIFLLIFIRLLRGITSSQVLSLWLKSSLIALIVGLLAASSTVSWIPSLGNLINSAVLPAIIAYISLNRRGIHRRNGRGR